MLVVLPVVKVADISHVVPLTPADEHGTMYVPQGSSARANASNFNFEAEETRRGMCTGNTGGRMVVCVVVGVWCVVCGKEKQCT
jgi:hypothetical protein